MNSPEQRGLSINRQNPAKCRADTAALLPRRPSGVLVPVLVSQSAGGLDVEVPMKLVNEHQVDVELLAVELQPQVSESLHLQQGALQGLHRRHLRVKG